jgi:antirestriction protein ArdC
MTTQEMQREALDRATAGQTMSNYPAIYAGFMARGIPESEIRPRENVFTFEAWRALGRHVRRGEHGVHVSTWVPVAPKVDAQTGEEIRRAGRRPKTAVVFHVSQTEAN